MLTPEAPPARAVISPDNTKIATYEWGDPEAPTVLAVHGFASSALVNFHATGWVRDLTRAGFHVIAIDQRGHGASDKPHGSSAYTMELLVTDVLTVLDTYMLDEVDYVGYSLGARVGWQAARAMPNRISRAVLGGIPDGDPLTRFRVDQAKAFVRDHTPVEDRLTAGYLTMAGAIPGNDIEALVALVEGMRGGSQPSADNAPSQQVLFATGSEDGILEASRALALAAPNATFFEIPGRHHFNAPTSRAFRDAAVDFLGAARAL
ncbi:alpha/beta fold hydrolase [Glaciihabitans sp. dw_435]|uniref:alpha/beta fold hydrolase n=1 Tax=Glaciihabitans sp. dw_435 TaxID=2720081 RepID=UPI001BD32514|nr:alpha/beta fold hydrolase [Glaciihabitans sp. dw_435]